MKLKKESDELDADRSPEKVAIKKYLEVAALASAFNILGPDPESHQRSIDMFLPPLPSPSPVRPYSLAPSQADSTHLSSQQL